MNDHLESLQEEALRKLVRGVPVGEPPVDLDAAILAAAMSSAPPIKTRHRPNWWRRLRAPLAVTVTALLATMLVLVAPRQPAVAPASVPAVAPAEQAPAPVETREAAAPATSQPAVLLPPAARGGIVHERSGREASKGGEPPPASLPQVAKAIGEARSIAADRAEASGPPLPSPASMQPGAQPAHSDEPTAGADHGASKVAPASADTAPFRATPAFSREGTIAPLKAQSPAPERHVAEIRALRRQGRNDEADRRLAELRRLFPDYELPADLR